MKREVKRQYKRDVKRLMLFVVLMLPLLLIASFLLDYGLHITGGWNIFLLVVIGGFGVLIMEVIYAKIQKAKAKKPKKKDPFAD